MRFYAKNSPRNSWSSHFMITIWNQKSRNARTPCTRLFGHCITHLKNFNVCTGGPHISWFLVPKGYHEMRGSWIPRTVFSIKPKNGSKKFPKSPFSADFQEISIFASQNEIVRIILTCLSIYLSKFELFNSIPRGFKPAIFNLNNCNSTLPSWTLSGHNCRKIWKFSIFYLFLPYKTWISH